MIRKLIICIAVLVGFCPMAWGTVDDVPNPKTYDADNWVSDPDHILDSETKNKINDILQQLEDSLTIEVAVVALNSIGEEEPHEFAVTLFNRWGVGKAEDDNGLLILLFRDHIPTNNNLNLVHKKTETNNKSVRVSFPYYLILIVILPYCPSDAYASYTPPSR